MSFILVWLKFRVVLDFKHFLKDIDSCFNWIRFKIFPVLLKAYFKTVIIFSRNIRIIEIEKSNKFFKNPSHGLYKHLVNFKNYVPYEHSVPRTHSTKFLKVSPEFTLLCLRNLLKSWKKSILKVETPALYCCLSTGVNIRYINETALIEAN